ncbi:serine hydrolase [Microbacteriaceae bacterium 4G12]
MFIKVAAIIIAVCIVGFIILVRMAKRDMNKVDPQYILSYINRNKHNKTCSLVVRKNGETICSVNEDVVLPLASMVKLIVAVEFAKQSANKVIDPNTYVSLKELEKYYIKNTDGGAHPNWLQDMKSNHKIQNDCVSLQNVAKGMLQYSSNANTAYLMNILGLENINRNIKELQLNQHEELYPFVAALYIPSVLEEQQKLNKKELLQKLKEMSQEEYRQYALDINKAMENELELPPLTHLSLDIQKNWSDRFTSASALDYISLLEKINSKNYFDESIHKQLDHILETIMENERNQKWLLHAGQKGGSTAFVLTNGLYATDKEGNTFEVVFMANELDGINSLKLRNNLNQFNLQVLTNEDFRKGVLHRLSTT